jgi:succinate dehydrogenase/fumarate reductase flavoprotein subunit
MGEKENTTEVSRRQFLQVGAAGIGASALVGLGVQEVEAQAPQQRWDMTADFVTIGAGTSGLAGAVSALEHGAAVIMVEENFDIGGHGMVSGGNVHLGGGNSRQKKFGIQDSADQVFNDWVRYDNRESRYSDRDLVRAFADENAATFEFLIANGVEFTDESTGPGAASTVPRQGTSVQWPIKSEIMTADPSRRGSGIVRALEKTARAKGAKILLKHKMTHIIRDSPTSVRVLGIIASAEGRTVRIEATKGVLIATGGHTSNVNFRRMFDPRLTEEYQVAGEPYSRQPGDGELAAMAIGAVLWGTASQTMEAGAWLNKTAYIGCRWGYSSLHWPADSPIFDRIKGTGLAGVDWQNVILVNQSGRRFYNELASGHDFLNAALAYSTNSTKLNGGGPIRAIFDADAVVRQKWVPKPPNVDPEYFFGADTVPELARAIVNPYQTRPMPAATLQETVTRYNSFVDAGADSDFKKPTPRYKIQTPPFYAAWSTPILHDSLCGLRTNPRAQVLDMQGQVIPGLYCAGESQGGFAQHGLGRAIVFGRIAGREAALSRS